MVALQLLCYLLVNSCPESNCGHFFFLSKLGRYRDILRPALHIENVLHWKEKSRFHD